MYRAQRIHDAAALWPAARRAAAAADAERRPPGGYGARPRSPGAVQQHNGFPVSVVVITGSGAPPLALLKFSLSLISALAQSDATVLGVQLRT
jgi:hypothetical protein